MEEIISCKTFNTKHGEVDYFEEGNKVFFRGTHICKILNIPSPSVNIRYYCKDVIKRIISAGKGKMEVLFIDIEGLDALINRSKESCKEAFGNELKEFARRKNETDESVLEIVEAEEIKYKKTDFEKKEVEKMENNSLVAFTNDAFGGIRGMEIDGKPWFVGKDIATVLGYKDPSSAVSKNVEERDKTTLLLEQDGSNYKSKTIIINESGLYDLILESRLPKARAFRHWITDEVLPSLTRTGSYSIHPTKANNIRYRSINSYSPDELRKLADLREKEATLREELTTVEVKIRNLSEDKSVESKDSNKPLSILDSIFCQNILKSPYENLNISYIAKCYGLDGVRLNNLLYEYGIQHKEGNIWVINDEYKDKGYTEMVNRDDYIYMVWTKEGQKFIYQLLREHGILPLIER